ncbi:hypothetical protein AVEN_58794-1 [Araneus ventricosus]|uniref:Uncharacterized protein n=1 Tax=Araneus ventricosus TaxID=182803 RepID=A0A4Y2Q402_ARAVE|nr:hypothetical protein AVEN_58794-1 [Araneus ventricosus]
MVEYMLFIEAESGIRSVIFRTNSAASGLGMDLPVSVQVNLDSFTGCPDHFRTDLFQLPCSSHAAGIECGISPFERPQASRAEKTNKRLTADPKQMFSHRQAVFLLAKKVGDPKRGGTAAYPKLKFYRSSVYQLFPHGMST